ncbi:hypothetical protein M0811_04666 [Anaeramoeba ignava]|uniref:Uncharacterized protein n=1 Tax=Anaeramoeba ignava TaxID=1746090 RepID=A0A9Q0RGN6_ANAIG|nr:hypothetical protein M0811_04666 [Anaeramoeba ignava]
MADSIPLIALIFLAIFNKFRHVHEDFYSMNISFSIANIFFFVYELLILLNLIGKINIKWSLVSLPLLIPSWLLNVILLILSIRLMSGK